MNGGPPGSVKVVSFTPLGQPFRATRTLPVRKRVTDAMMKMIELDVMTLEKAYRG